ncbi:dihydropteridine reductase [Rhopalosiphum maidis]|uniref:dihydropteridine reductase n=1 Tax=Rhopalosiphum maidis TaxID=43146 RepID=UPI000EFEF88D|nr:dihydropteridine reductase [Rhopalosiphum maidis]XP_026823071.1 dihydropteridine reductase [Rhopalosiphum maidis]
MAAGKVLVYGGKGALGSTCISLLSSQKYWVGSIDLTQNENANANVIVERDATILEQESQILKELDSVLGSEKLDAVICVAGGWAGGSSSSDDFVKNTDLMLKQSVWSSVLASSIASKFLKPGGILVLTGAKAALGPTPGMIGYGLAKAAIHHLTKSLADENGGLPTGAQALSILPVTLDTPINRKWMPKADTSTWTPLEFVAELFSKWIKNEERPPNGSLVQLNTKENKTTLDIE